MRIPLIQRWLQIVAEPGTEAAAPKKRRRLGVTAMEYLVMASLITVVLIMTIQHLGAITGGLFGKSAHATNKTVTTGS
jgi:Flp pilus assembly pilin Flp